MCHETKKKKKEMIFGGISKKRKTPLIIIERDMVDANSYVDDLNDQSGLIPDMNFVYEIKGWTLMQDGATAQTCESTLEYLHNCT